MAFTLYDEALEALEDGPEPGQSALQSPLYQEAADTLRSMDQSSETPIRRSIRQAAETTPDRAAETRRLSLTLGVPSAVIERHLDEYRRRDALAKPYGAMQQQTPHTAAWLEEPSNAAIAKDDLESLGALEWLVTAPQRSFANGVAQLQFSDLRWKSIFGTLTREEQDRLESYRYALQQGGAQGAGQSWFRKAVTGSAQQLPVLFGATLAAATSGALGALGGAAVGAGVGSLVPGVGTGAGAAAGATTGGRAGLVTGAALFSARMEAGLAYDEYLGITDEHGEPLDPQVAKVAALGTGALNGGLEVVGLGALAKSIPGINRLTGVVGRNAVKQALKSPTVRAALADAMKSYGGVLTTETAVEVAQRAVTIMSGELAKATGDAPTYRSPSDIGADLMREAVGALQSFALISLPGPTLQIAGAARQVAQAQQSAAFFTALGEGVANSKTMARAPEALRDLLERATKDGPIAQVYAPIDTWTTYWQSKGVDPAQMAAQVGGSRESYQRAVQTGDDLVIPTGQYAVTLAGTDHNAFFAQELRLAPGEMNAREATAFQAREATAFQAQLEAVPAEIADTGAASAGLAIRTHVVEQLAAAGFPAETAETYATLQESAFQSLGQRAGLDPVALFNRYGLTVERPGLAPVQLRPLAAPGAAGLPMTPASAQAEAATTPLGPDEVAALLAEPAVLQALERRQARARELPPGQAERRAPAPPAPSVAGLSPEEEIGLLDVGAAARRMLLEDPSLRGRARAAQARAAATPRFIPPALDIAAAEQEDIADVTGTEGARAPARPGRRPALRRVAESTPPARESPRQRITRRSAHYADVLATVFDAALSLDPNADEAAIRKEFDDRVEMVESLDAEWQESGHNLRTLLDAIAQAGGLSVEAERRGGGMVGELTWIRESKALKPGGEFGGVRGVFRVRTLGARGLERTGLSLDDMTRMLNQDSRFAYIEDINDLLLALEEVSRQGEAAGKGTVFPGTDELARRAGINLRVRWWAGPAQTELSQASALFEDEPPADVRETGEPPPRLPDDVGLVRQQAIATPAREAPFALTAEVSKAPGTQETLFQTVFHGSPAVFERFSLHAIGTGEGAQSYGWGLYFASQREVADRYRESLAGAQRDKGLLLLDLPIYAPLIGVATRAEDPIERQGFAELQARALFHQPGPNAIAQIRDELTRSAANLEAVLAEGQTFSGSTQMDRGQLSDMRAALAVLDTYGKDLHLAPPDKPGRTYKVEIPEDEDYLDWDKPASAQSPKIQTALRALGVTWQAFTYPTLDDAIELLDARLDHRPSGWGTIETDVGEILLEGLHYARDGNEIAFRRWYDQHHQLAGDETLNPTGAEIYRHLTTRVGSLPSRAGQSLAQAAEGASRNLNGQGVAGIRYLDGFSRSTGEGSSNYVLFDDRLVHITEFFQAAGRARLATDGTYHTDLFGTPLEGPVPTDETAGPAPGDVDAARALQVDDVAGEFATRTQLVTEKLRPLGASTVLTAQDAATATAYLARGAQERFDALVTDAAGTPLAVVGSFKGNVDETPVYVEIVTAEAFRIKGAAAIWLSHNHPSGTATLTAPDKAISEKLAEAFRGTAIEAKGMLAIGAGAQGAQQFQHYDPTTEITADGAIGKAIRGVSVPVIEREFATTGKLTARVTGPDMALEVVPALARGQFGIVLTDTRNQPIGFVPVDPEAAAELRTAGRLDWLYRALSIAGPRAALISVPEVADLSAALNLANALTATNVHVLDIIATPIGEPARSLVLGGSGLSLSGRFEQPRRGSIRFGPDRQMNIDLLANANLSTFLHETGHFFLEVLRDLANAPGASEQIRADMRTLDQWFFADDDTTQTIGVEQHEQFARGFEAYLMEGKAPSLELRAAFARFRAWLVGIYRSLRGLNVTLTDEVRGVMDRLLATDQAIADAAADAHIAPMFTDARSAGMTDTQFSLYRATVLEASTQAHEALQQKLLSEVQREQTAEWTRQRQEIRDLVEPAIHTQPVYVALAAIRQGTYPDGSPLIAGQAPTPMKLSRQAIVDQFGAARLKSLPKPYVYSVEGGMDPTTAAELFGFSSADALLTAIAAAPPLRQAIEAETDRRMLAEHGSLLLDGTLHEKAQAALANDARATVIRAELRALGELRRTVAPHVRVAAQAEQRERSYERRWFEAEAKLRIAIAEGHQQVEIDALQDEVDNLKRKAAGGPAVIAGAIPPQQVMTDAAHTRVAQTRIRDLRPQVFWSAARRAGRGAIDAAARQDFDAAIVAHQQQLLNLALFREAERALDDTEQRVRQAKDLSRPAARQRLGKAGGSFLEHIDGLLEQYAFTPTTGPQLGTRAELRRWIAAMEGEGLSVELPDELLEDARRVHYSELTYEALVGVTDGLTQIAHLARLTLRRLQSAKAEDYQATRDGLVSSIEAHGTPREVKLEFLPKDRPARIVGEWIASHTKLSQFVAALDGYLDGGPMWDAIMRPVNEAATKQASINEAAAVAMSQILKTHYTGRELARFHDLMTIDAIGASLSKEARLAVALNWGNEGNRQRLMEHTTRRWNAQQVQAILDTLDRRDLQFVQDSLDYINSFWPEIAAKQQRVFGLAPEKVEAATWRHAVYGEQKGGYYPIAYDARLSVRRGNIIDADVSSLQKHANYAYATTKRGYTKARDEQVNAPVRLELSVMYEHVEAVIHDLSHHEMLIDVGRLLGDRHVQGAIQSRQGDIVYRQIRGALLDVALGTRHASTAADRAINWVKNGTTIAGLGWNVWTAVQQPLGIFNAAARIGPTWVAKGLVHVFRDASSLEWSARWVHDKSEMMRLRHGTLTREIADLRSTLKRSGSWFDNALRTVTRDHLEQEDLTSTFLFLIQKAQQLADLPVWIGGYEKAMAAGETEATAIALADQGVLDSQSGGQIKDLAQVQRGEPFFRTLTVFYSYGNLLFNQTARAFGQTNVRRAGSVGQLLGNLLLLYAAPAATTVAMAMAFGKDDPDDDFVALMGREMLATAMNTMVLVRELGGAAQMIYAQSMNVPARAGRGYEGPTGLRLFASLGRLAQQATQGVADRGLLRAAEDVAGVLFHLPLAQVQRSIDGFVALEEGRTNNPAALLMGAPPKASGQ